jgi:hypothetical protein
MILQPETKRNYNFFEAERERDRGRKDSIRVEVKRKHLGGKREALYI